MTRKPARDGTLVTVNTERFVSAGLYVPFRGAAREAGAVGTLYIDAEATGDGSGGIVQIHLNMSRIEFGFHPLWVPTHISTQDALASPEVVQVNWSETGNERQSAGLREHVLGITQSSINIAVFTQLGVIIEPNLQAGGRIMTANWATNTNSAAYHLHIFGPIYDGEFLARGKAGTPELLAGLR